MEKKLTWHKNEKKQGYLEVAGTEYQLPYTIISGGDGPVTLITAGIHSAEYVGIQAALELSAELEPGRITGTVILVPLANPSGFSHRTMSMVYEDGKNLNREFPGSPDGTVADRICHTITTELLALADYYIDLHSGDGYEELSPYVYYVGPVEPAVREQSRCMAGCVDVEYAVESGCTTGGAYNYASTRGIPSVLIERGGCGLWSQAEVEADKADVRRILNWIFAETATGRGCDTYEDMKDAGDVAGVIKDIGTAHKAETKGTGDAHEADMKDTADTYKAEMKTAGATAWRCDSAVDQLCTDQTVLTEVIYENAPCAGFWYPSFHAGDHFVKGEVLGEIRDCFGRVLYTSRASGAGVMLYQTISLCVLENGPMVAYGILP